MYTQRHTINSSMDISGAVLFILALALSNNGSPRNVFHVYGKEFNVMDYGAKSDGQTENSQAFGEAWNAACGDSTPNPKLIVPSGHTFLVNPIMFRGPCQAPEIHFVIAGTIIAPDRPGFWDGKDASQWLGFEGVKGLKVDGFGNGTIDGRGKAWWDQSCRYNPHLKTCTSLAPTALRFLSCDESIVRNVGLKDSAQTHILIMGCNGFNVNNVVMMSPGSSPNTDGIHIQDTQHLSISNSSFGVGDDCISIGDRIRDINIQNVKCGPGHGISIGSLGRSGNYVQVENISVTNAYFTGTTNGARIKTWQVGRGYVRNIKFENLTVDSVKNPIIIDQNYCEVRDGCKEQETGVQISQVVYRGMSGTSSTEIAINLKCSSSVPCRGILMEDIHLTSAMAGKVVTTYCRNAHGNVTDVAPDSTCLLD
ncbi:polygalacturonase ADPG1-like [Andrographis paniculata]|uniref:polygalacturonase ADPG1-like n=1 Tax=Andrographis paniculata TaxID=175694 RepID=UPI0021E986D7|nr:polygalacturonase ADPG1-like [Andrographis paniculata]